MADSYTIKDQYASISLRARCISGSMFSLARLIFKSSLDSLKFCQKEKGLRIYGWVIMTNHLHMIVDSDKVPLSDIIRDFKKYTATQIIKAIEANPREGRKNWLLWLLKKTDTCGFGKKAIMQKKYSLPRSLKPNWSIFT